MGWYGLDWSGGGQGPVEGFLFSTASGPALESTQPPVRLVPLALFLWVKRPGQETDHLLPPDAEVNNDGDIH
jgi:hypothetical protein